MAQKPGRPHAGAKDKKTKLDIARRVDDPERDRFRPTFGGRAVVTAAVLAGAWAVGSDHFTIIDGSFLALVLSEQTRWWYRPR